MNHYVSSDQLLELAETANEIVANWNQKDRIVALLIKIYTQKMPSDDSDVRHLLGRWS